MGQNSHAEGMGEFTDATANPAKADDAQDLTRELDKWRLPKGERLSTPQSPDRMAWS